MGNLARTLFSHCTQYIRLETVIVEKRIDWLRIEVVRWRLVYINLEAIEADA